MTAGVLFAGACFVVVGPTMELDGVATSFSGLNPELVWGLLPRFVGLLYFIAFSSLGPQLLAALGPRGAAPIQLRLERIRRDFPGARRFFEFPTLFWLNSSERMLRLVPIVGALCGVCAIYGGVPGKVAIAIACVLWLSCEPAGLIFPWDTMLQEVGFLALFLPIAEELPSLHASTLPLPAVAFMWRWLVLRLMLGFGKVKFIGTEKGDSLYLRGFMVWAPLPTPLAWWGHYAPRWFLRASLYFMFFGEVIAPVLGFFSGPLRLVSFAALTMLMLGIQATGNWGFFNLGYILLCFGLLDTQSSIFDLGREPWASTWMQWPDLAVNGVMLFLFLSGLVYFVVFESWSTRTWMHWPWDDLVWNRAWARAFLAFHRALAPFRIVNGYGVFPATAQPPIRILPVFEGSDDGVTWHQYNYRHMPSLPKSRLPIVAPHHPRMDQAMHYAAFGMHDGSFFATMMGDGNPYQAFAHSCWLDRAMQRLLTLKEGEETLIQDNPFPNEPPKFVRMSTYALTPTQPSERRATGRLWRRRRLGTFIEARGLETWPDALATPEPELFSYDHVGFRRRSLPLRRIGEAFAAGMEPDRAVLEQSDLTAAEVAKFWAEIVPFLAEARGDWSRLDERARALRSRFPLEQLFRFERILERFAWLLRLKTERHHWGDAQPKIPLKSNFRYHLLLHEIILDGKAAYEAVLADPALAAARAERTTDASQLWTLAVMRYESMLLHIRTFRWSEVGRHAHRYNVPGIFEFYPLLSSHVPPEEDFCPRPQKHPNGEFTIEGIYPAPPYEEDEEASPALGTGGA